MKDFVNRFKKDLNRLQDTIQKEGDDLVKKLATRLNASATGKNIVAKTKELEQILEQKIKKFEPAIDNFYKNVKANAEKAGIDINEMKKHIDKATKAAKSRIAKVRSSVKKKSSGKKRSKKSQKSASAK
jgi:hypothetical protein